MVLGEVGPSARRALFDLGCDIYAGFRVRESLPRVLATRLAVNEAQECIFKLDTLNRKSKENPDSRKEEKTDSPIKKRTRSGRNQIVSGGEQSSPQINPSEAQFHLVDEHDEAPLVVVEDDVADLTMESVKALFDQDFGGFAEENQDSEACLSLLPLSKPLPNVSTRDEGGTSKEVKMCQIVVEISEDINLLRQQASPLLKGLIGPHEKEKLNSHSTASCSTECSSDFVYIILQPFYNILGTC